MRNFNEEIHYKVASKLLLYRRCSCATKDAIFPMIGTKVHYLTVTMAQTIYSSMNTDRIRLSLRSNIHNQKVGKFIKSTLKSIQK